MTPRQRYNEAHRLWFSLEYPGTFKDGHYTPPLYPDVTKANGLTNYVLNYIKWAGYRSTRVNVQGRLIDKAVKTEAGNIFYDKRMIKSSTRKGAADVSSTIKGRSVMWEIKVGRDRPSQAQLDEQARERKAGGEYFFTRTVEEFLDQFDTVAYG